MKLLYLLFFLFLINTQASTIDFSKNTEYALIESMYLIDNNNKNYKDILKSKDFKKSEKDHLNLGFARNQSVWLSLKLHNPTNTPLSKILEIRNPLLEKVMFYDNGDIHTTGMLYKHKNDRFINNTYELELKANETRKIYIHIQNQTTALRFGVYIKDKNNFLIDEQIQQYLSI